MLITHRARALSLSFTLMRRHTKAFENFAVRRTSPQTQIYSSSPLNRTDGLRISDHFHWIFFRKTTQRLVTLPFITFLSGEGTWSRMPSIWSLSAVRLCFRPDWVCLARGIRQSRGWQIFARVDRQTNADGAGVPCSPKPILLARNMGSAGEHKSFDPVLDRFGPGVRRIALNGIQGRELHTLPHRCKVPMLPPVVFPLLPGFEKIVRPR